MKKFTVEFNLGDVIALALWSYILIDLALS